jgi:hypothetical protein
MLFKIIGALAQAFDVKGSGCADPNRIAFDSDERSTVEAREVGTILLERRCTEAIEDRCRRRASAY